MLLLRYRTRKLVFRSLIILYFFVATWLLLFANGYRVQLHPLLLSKTGNILATFEPTTADVYLDGVLVANSSPTRLRAIFPGPHELSIKKSGFLPYTQAIRIEPQQTSFISDVFLLKDDQVEKISGAAAALAASAASSTSSSSTIAADLQRITGTRVQLSSDAEHGTRIVVDGTPKTSDLGVGAWNIVGGDANVVAVARLDTDEIQFRAWNMPNISIASLPGHRVISQTFKSSHSLFTISNFELWRFNSDQHTAELIYRFSSPILAVVAVPDTTTLVVALPDQIVAFHVGDHHYIPTVIARGTVVSETLTRDGRSIIYTVQSGNTTSTLRRALY